MKNSVKVAIGLSGGVDSAVAAHLLKEAGYDVTGVFLTCWSQGMGCSTQQDRQDAVRVAKHLGVPIKIWDFEQEYQARVIERFFAEYERGWTPNPDIWCNTEIKFGLFLEKALSELRVDYIATGHYARVACSNGRGWWQVRPAIKGPQGRSVATGDQVAPASTKGATWSRLTARLNSPASSGTSDSRWHLLAGLDSSKDQSYFLYRLNQFQLSRSLSPLGSCRKQVIRMIAKRIGLHNAEKPDSQGICFVGRVDLKDFLQQRIKLHPGEVINTRGEVIGQHDGVEFYTVGQRHGFEITKYQGAPLYIVRKDAQNNRLVVGRDEESDVKRFVVEDLHWINQNEKLKMKNEKLLVRIRHLGEMMPCTMEVRGQKPEVGETGGLLVKLEEPTRGVAPGQHAVFYLGDEVLGGGVIKEAVLKKD